MDYERAARKYKELRDSIAKRETEFAASLIDDKKLVADIEAWFALKTKEEGLTEARTAVGLVYWSTHNSATVAEPTAFKDFVVSSNAWDLMEVRASKTAVKSYIDGNGSAPPGVSFSSRKVFNFKPTSSKE